MGVIPMFQWETNVTSYLCFNLLTSSFATLYLSCSCTLPFSPLSLLFLHFCSVNVSRAPLHNEHEPDNHGKAGTHMSGILFVVPGETMHAVADLIGKRLDSVTILNTSLAVNQVT